MKNFSASLLAFLKSTNAFNRADLFAIALSNGMVIRATSCQADLNYLGNTYFASKNGAWERGAITSEASFDLRANDMDLLVKAAGLETPLSTIFFPMPISFTLLASDPLNGANQNPLNPAVWTADPTLVFPSCQISSGFCTTQSLVAPNDEGANTYTGITWPADQWAEFQVNALPTVGSPDGSSVWLVLRSAIPQNTCYAMALFGNSGSSDGLGNCDLQIQVYINNAITPVAILSTGKVNAVAGDIFRFAVCGQMLTVYQNGNPVQTTRDNRIVSGDAGIFLQSNTNFAQVSHFNGGSTAPLYTIASYMAAAQLGLFDAAIVQVWTAYWPIGLTRPSDISAFIASVGVETKWFGFIKPNGEIARSQIKFQCADGLYILNQNMPRRLLQASCIHTLFDANCTLLAGNFESPVVTVASGSTRQSLNTTATLGQAVPYFSQGYVTFLTGQNAGLTFAIKAQTSTTNLLLASATPLPLAIGDTFRAFAGCDKTQATCNNKFANLIHYGGTDFVPNPEVAI